MGAKIKDVLVTTVWIIVIPFLWAIIPFYLIYWVYLYCTSKQLQKDYENRFYR